MNLDMIKANVVSILSVIAGGVLAYYSIEGWGWFLAVAVLCYTTLETKSSEEDDKQ